MTVGLIPTGYKDLIALNMLLLEVGALMLGIELRRWLGRWLGSGLGLGLP